MLLLSYQFRRHDIISETLICWKFPFSPIACPFDAVRPIDVHCNFAVSDQIGMIIVHHIKKVYCLQNRDLGLKAKVTIAFFWQNPCGQYQIFCCQ